MCYRSAVKLSMGNIIAGLAARFAFFPPVPSTYELGKDANGKISMMSFRAHACRDVDIRMLNTKVGTQIVAAYWRHPRARFTLLYSHGNAADLGLMMDFFFQLRSQLRVNLVSYDYSGYGASSGKATEHNTYADIEAVYHSLRKDHGVKQEDLILYGQSVGSGPTLYLASKLPRLKAVILQSAILSGIRVLYPVRMTFCFDIFKNINRIELVKCPVLVIHGTDDDIVNWSHGKRLWELCQEQYEPLWIKGGGHCNLELYPEFMKHLRKFIRSMEKRSVNNSGRKSRTISANASNLNRQPA